MENVTIEQFDLGARRLREFVRFAWRLYDGDAHWTPPLNGVLLGNRLLGMTGLLTADHPYHKHATVTHFLARRDGEVVGRISAAVNHRFNEYHGTKIGSFGFFEVVEDYEVAAALLDAARDWIVSQGMDAMRGPGEYSNATHERQGILIHGFDTDPTVECTHNPPYYAEFLERWGLGKVKDYVAYMAQIAEVPEKRLHALAERARVREKIAIRPVDMSVFNEEVKRVIDIYNRAWADNWGCLPITEEEADTLADTLKPIGDPGLMFFSRYEKYVDTAMLGAFPDPNWALKPRWKWYGDSDLVRAVRLLRKRRRIPRIRLMFFGVVPGHRKLGTDALMYWTAFQHMKSHGYEQVEASLLLEDNELIIRPSAAMSGKHYKTWRIYELAVGDEERLAAGPEPAGANDSLQ